MQDRGYTVTSLAEKVGVDPPAISRILRTPKDVQGDPGGRNPSMGLASQICNVLRIDPTAAFPDIFNADRYEPRHQPGNVGSGDHAHGKGGEKWTSGVSESIDDTIDDLEASATFDAMCEEVTDLPFDQLWRRAFWPAVRRIRPGTTVTEFVNTMRDLANGVVLEFEDKRVQGHINRANARGFQNFVNQGQPQQGKPDQAKMQAKAEAMTQKIMPPVKRAFAAAMNKLKADLQQVQTQAGANPKIAPHAWEIVNRFYNTVMQAGASYQPKWKAQPKGTGSTYDAAYQKAKNNFQPTQPEPAPQPKPAPQSTQPAPANNADPLAVS